MKNKFNEDDKQKVIDFLNKVAKHAKFEFNTQESIEYVKLLSHMQQVILSKLHENILEIKRVVEAEPEKEKPKKKINKKN